MSRQILHTILSLVLVGVSGPSWLTVRAQSQPTFPIVVPAKFDAEGLSEFLIPVTVREHTFWCKLDSGGSWVFSLDRDKAARAGLMPTGSGFSAGVGPDVIRDQRVQDAAVKIGALELRQITIVLKPLPAVVPDMDCIFGLGLLQEYAAEFDYETPRLRLYRTGTYTAPANATSLPFEIDRARNPYVSAELAMNDGSSVTGHFLLDTGAGYYAMVMTQAFIDTHQLMPRVGPMLERVSDMPGLRLAATRQRALKIGSLEMAAPVTALLLTHSAGQLPDGLIGAGFLRRFTVTFDYGQRRAWFVPNRYGNDSQPFDASGLQVRLAGDGAIAAVAVVPNSPAAEAGIQVGDRLNRVAGREARTLTFGEIIDVLSRPDTDCELELLRQDGPHTVRLRLRKLL